MAIDSKLNYLQETKNQIKDAIIQKGVGVLDTDSFRSYAHKIEQIESGTQGDFSDYVTETNLGYNSSYALQRIFKKLPDTICSFLNINNTRNMADMFRSCINLIELNLSSLDTSAVTSMTSMFNDCSSLTELNLSSFDTSNVNNMTYMFYGCSSLTKLNLSSFDTSNVTSTERMFYGCGNLTNINGILNLISVINVNTMFFNCNSLQTVNIKNLNKTGLDLSKSVNLLKDSLMYLINNLVETQDVKTLTLGATNLAKLTDEEKAIATEKNWTLS